MIKAWRYFLVFPDGLVQEIDEDPHLQVGSLLGAERAHISEGPEGKYRCIGIHVQTEPDAPGIRRYVLTPVEPSMV